MGAAAPPRKSTVSKSPTAFATTPTAPFATGTSLLTRLLLRSRLKLLDFSSASSARLPPETPTKKTSATPSSPLKRPRTAQICLTLPASPLSPPTPLTAPRSTTSSEAATRANALTNPLSFQDSQMFNQRPSTAALAPATRPLEILRMNSSKPSPKLSLQRQKMVTLERLSPRFSSPSMLFFSQLFSKLEILEINLDTGPFATPRQRFSPFPYLFVVYRFPYFVFNHA